MNKVSYDIGNIKKINLGFGKYCLENVEKEYLNILTHSYKTDMTWRTRKFGTLSFSASYKF
jgi:hypothetical protein